MSYTETLQTDRNAEEAIIKPESPRVKKLVTEDYLPSLEDQICAKKTVQLMLGDAIKMLSMDRDTYLRPYVNEILVKLPKNEIMTMFITTKVPYV